MDLQRPDLSNVSPEVRAYIEALEAALERRRGSAPAGEGAAVEPAEPPTTLNLITVSEAGLAKRTPRHLYERQRRGGMGVFDLETTADDAPRLLAVADVAHNLIVITSQARAFLWPVDRLPETPVRGRGEPLPAALGLPGGEHVAAVLPAGHGPALALLSRSGYVRVLPAHVVSQNMTPGTALYRYNDFGPLAAAAWTTGAGDLFVATRRGLGIRFPERALPLNGGLGIRLEGGDEAVAVVGVSPPDGQAIFLLGADGRGTVRLMAGFSANKSPGGGGKLALKADDVVGAVPVAPGDDLFIISKLSKVIRFAAAEVPAKEGVVQGVNCMTLRGDVTRAVVASSARSASEVE